MASQALKPGQAQMIPENSGQSRIAVLIQMYKTGIVKVRLNDAAHPNKRQICWENCNTTTLAHLLYAAVQTTNLRIHPWEKAAQAYIPYIEMLLQQIVCHVSGLSAIRQIVHTKI